MPPPPKPTYASQPLSAEAKLALLSMSPGGGVAALAQPRDGLKSLADYATQGSGEARTAINDYLANPPTHMESRIPSVRERVRDYIRYNVLGGPEESKADRSDFLTSALEAAIPPLGVATGMEDAAESYSTGHPFIGTAQAAMAVVPGVHGKKFSLNKQGWFSPAMEAVHAAKQEKFSPEQAVKLLTGPNSGVKREELQETGVLDFIDLMRDSNQPITKDLLLGYLRDNRIKLKETRYGPAETLSPYEYDTIKTDPDKKSVSHGGAVYESPALDTTYIPGTNHSSYVLPTNPQLENTYREIVIREPMPTPRETDFDPLNGGKPRAKYRQENHWSDANPIVHIRMQDRIDPNTQGKMLSIEEIQSDWGQEARKAKEKLEGYGYKIQGWRGTRDPQIEDQIIKRKSEIEDQLEHWDNFEDEQTGDIQYMSYYEAHNSLQSDLMDLRSYQDKLRNDWLHSPVNSVEGVALGKERAEVAQEIATKEQALKELRAQGQPLTDELETLNRIGSVIRRAPEHNPYIADTNKYVDLALKRSLIEAARGDYDGIMVIPGEVHVDRWGADGLGGDREKGLKRHYDDVIPNRMKDLVRKLDKNAQLEELDTGAENPVNRTRYEEGPGDYSFDDYTPEQINSATRENILPYYIAYQRRYGATGTDEYLTDSFNHTWDNERDFRNGLVMDFLYTRYKEPSLGTQTVKAKGFRLTPEMKKKILEGLSIMSLGGVVALPAAEHWDEEWEPEKAR